MSCKHEDGEEIAYCGKPEGENNFRLVELRVSHATPTGYAKVPVFSTDGLGDQGIKLEQN